MSTTDSNSTVSIAGTELTSLEAVAVGLTLFSAVTHVYAGVVEGAPPVLLAGLGFVGGAVLFIREYRRRLLTGLAIPFTGVQIPLWYVVKAGNYTIVGYVDKVAQIALIIVLGLLLVDRD
ncbi:hypothetical protein RYH80_19040 [Halobaculum sp. MBLA0147]|uniref:hypothetical protein n=1 Tax=Halobaculum sp. MBLA0147 TaxID=3079934 RepID=UPI0035266EF4